VSINGIVVRSVSLLGPVAIALAACGASPAAGSTGHSVTALKAVKVSSYGEVVANDKSFSLYLLDKNGAAHACTGSCTSIWPPLVVSKGTHVSGATGLKGKIGLVARGAKEQVTYNGWPVYAYVGDSGKAQSAGEGIKSFGGTWYLLRASATRHNDTPVQKSSSSGGGGGW
jgi:predicted lipoprotein with Yx(FWY)xxD motif